MKPSFQFLVTITSANQKIEVIINAVTTAVTVPTGSYYHTHDSDTTNSLPAVIMDALNDAALGATFQVGIDSNGRYYIKCDTTFKLSSVASSIYSVIGFTSDQLDPALGHFSITANEQASYGWYADDIATLTGDIELPNIMIPVIQQRNSMAGILSTGYYGINQQKDIDLQWVSKRKMFNTGGVYDVYNGGDSDQNEALELFYNYAIKGNKFRYYRDFYDNIVYKGNVTSIVGGGGPTVLSDSSAAWETDEWINHIVEIYNSTSAYEVGHRAILTGNTATVLKCTGGWPSFVPTNGSQYVIRDLRYDTYVLDASTKWEPELMFADMNHETFSEPSSPMYYRLKLRLRKFI